MEVVGLRSQVSGLRSQVSGLRSQVLGLRSKVSGLGPWVPLGCPWDALGVLRGVYWVHRVSLGDGSGNPEVPNSLQLYKSSPTGPDRHDLSNLSFLIIRLFKKLICFGFLGPGELWCS